ncbi:MAG: Ca-activated chloride channel family protein [Verrucomicrobia bacterium]|nr:MAG: Ca-activated chloride channel family protein [Verrucomicrobiota bacterium]
MTPGGHLVWASPWAFGLLALVPVLAWRLAGSGTVAAVRFPGASLLRQVGRPVRASKGRARLGLMLLGWTALVVSLARPQLAKDLEVVKSSGIDILIALDVSRSMLAEDFTIGGKRASRIDAVKQLTEEFLENRSSDRIGMIAFAGRPYLVSPLTLNHDWLKENLKRIRIGMVEDGTAIGSALASATRRLGENTDAHTRIIVLLTDGDNNAGQISPNTAAEAARALGIKIYTICAGTQGYVDIPVKDMFGNTVYQKVLVTVDESQTRKVAEIGGGKFYRATDSAALKGIFEDINKLEKVPIETQRSRHFRDLFHWPLAFGIGCIVAALGWALTAGRRLP